MHAETSQRQKKVKHARRLAHRHQALNDLGEKAGKGGAEKHGDRQTGRQRDQGTETATETATETETETDQETETVKSDKQDVSP